MDNLIFAGVAVGLVVAALFTVGMIVARLYRRASKEVSFVRTGFGGQKVVVNGGALVLPVLHETIPVNMNTLRLEVKRANQAALITRDRMRVDVQAEFYVRVQPTEDAIAAAAQTLGMKTMSPDQLKELVEGKFVDALRAVAAEMTMEELHEKRVDFAQRVQQVVSGDIMKNGLELESVSLTGLDQTSREFFNPNNAFDAEGLTKLTEEIEIRRKKRNEIEQDTNVAVQQKNLEAEQKSLELAREQEYARLKQQREIEIRRAEQVAEIAREQAEKQRQAEEAQIAAKQQVDMARILAERAVEEEKIQMTRVVESAEVEKLKTIELAEQGRAIAIAIKSKEQSEAQAEADRARAAAAAAEEKVVTVRELERAERQKSVELVEAQKLAEREAINVRVAAEAERQAAEDRATALKTIAGADAEKVRIAAQGDADAERLRAEAASARYEVEATGRRGLHEADNVLSPEQIAMQVRLALLKHLPEIIKESVRPMSQIDGIKIVQVEGLAQAGGNVERRTIGPGGGVDDGESRAAPGSLADQVINSALRYRAQAPLVDALMSELGLNGADINGLTAGLGLTGNARKQG